MYNQMCLKNGMSFALLQYSIFVASVRGKCASYTRHFFSLVKVFFFVKDGD